MRLYITLDSDEADRLAEIAKRERRRLRDQAAFLLTRTLGSLERPESDWRDVNASKASR